MSSTRNEDSFLLENYKKIVMKLEDNNLESHITPFEDFIIDSYYKKMPKHRSTKSMDFRAPLPTISENEKRTTDTFSPLKKKFPNEIPTDTQSSINLHFKTFVKNDFMAQSHRKYISQVSTLVKLSKDGMIEGLNKRHTMTNLIRSIKPGTKWQIMASDENQNYVKVFDATSYPESVAGSTGSPSPQKSQIETTDRLPDFKSRASFEMPGLNMDIVKQSYQADKQANGDKMTPAEAETRRRSIIQIDADEYQKEKEIEDRANIIQRMRRTKKSPEHSATHDKSSKEKSREKSLHKRSQSQNNFPHSEDKSEFRFLDKLIIHGKVPVDAINYFTGKKQKFLRGVALKEEELENPEILRQTMPTIVPKWLAHNTRFEHEHKVRMQHVKIPVFEIVAKEPGFREQAEKYYVANYIMKLDLFAKFSFNIVFRLSEKLEAKKLEEGEILCKEGDIADTVYIVYAGEVGIFVGELQTLVQRAGPGEYLGRQALDAPGKRAATLKATKKSHILLLDRSYYQSITGGYSGMGKGAINLKDEILAHPFFLMFSELKKIKFMSEANVRKYYKHEVPIKPGEESDRFMMLIKGKAIRELQVTMNKENKWPEEYDFWKVKKFQKVYVVPLPIEAFELVGFTEMLEKIPRKEKVVVTEDSWMLSMTRSTFLTIFDEEDVHRFKMKAFEDDEKKSKKLSQLFEIEEMATKQKSEAIMDAMNMNAIEKGRNGQFRQDDKRLEMWKIFKDNHEKEQAKRKKLIDIKKTEFIIPRADFLD